ncbi:MAG: recombinase family protein [Anaerolineae bacterium]|nr:recombinase family protein [Anaerolineae bacterium]
MARKRIRLNPDTGFVKYLRTSDEEVQAPERSQAAQRRDIQQRLIAYHPILDLGEYVDNYTGTSADRKHYQQMLADARRGKFSHVFAATPDRFGRDDVEALRAIDEMTRLGICVRFASHPDLNPSDPDDRLYLNILFGMAKRESAITGKRTTGGMLSKLLKGEWTWRAPDGYVNREVKITELDRGEQLQHARYKRWVEIDSEQAQVWRYAWDLLLQDSMTLDQICEALAARGYRFRSGAPFVQYDKLGRLVYRRKDVSKVFHSWFYAGWVVVDNDWANIPPKTVRGNWEPVVSTEEFERGLAILARRNHMPQPQKRYFYLLQGLVYLERANGSQIKLTCSRPNTKRTANGAAYYCIPSSHLNYACSDIDEQIPSHLQRVQVEPAALPKIRRAYLADIEHYTGSRGREQKQLEDALRRCEQRELNLWRAFTDHGMQAPMYQKLAKEYQEERQRIEFALRAIKQENREYIASLDAALEVIAEIETRYLRQDGKRRREILRQIVSKVVIDEAGVVVRLELHPPFTYLYSLKNRGGSVNGHQPEMKGNKKKTSSEDKDAGRSLQVFKCDRNPTQSERSALSLASDYIEYLEFTSFPQRITLEQLLIDEQ